MSWFSIEPPAQNDITSSIPALPPLSNASFHPVSDRYPSHSLFGSLADEDTAWLAQSSGFVTETQTIYITMPGGKLLMCQVIHSAIGLWYPQINFTFRYYDPHSKTHIWKSTNVSNFKTPPPTPSGSSAKYDRRSCRADQFSILLDPARPDRYTVIGKHDDTIQLEFTITRMAGVPGWKLGQDARGGFTYFGQASAKSTKAGPDYLAGVDGYLVHRFWPRCSVDGHVVMQGKTLALDGSRAIFIHAVQGMRPNLIASRWNFCNFQSVRSDDPAQAGADPGVSLTLMEFTSVPGSYGPPQTVSVGSIVVGDKLVGISCGPSAGAASNAKTTHQAPFFLDRETGYQAPSAIRFEWLAPLLEPVQRDAAPAGDQSLAKAELVLDLHAQLQPGTNTYVTQGLVEKVDVMAQIPYLVKKVVAAVAGARPYIYTWMNPTVAKIQVPKLSGDGMTVVDQSTSTTSEGGEMNGRNEITVDGYLFNEATFISD